MNLEKRSNEIKARITEIKGLIGAEVTLEVLEQLEAEVDELINSKVEKFKSSESKSKSAADLETDLEQLSDMEEFNE